MNIATILQGIGTPLASRKVTPLEAAAVKLQVSRGCIYSWISRDGIPRSRNLLSVLEAIKGSDNKIDITDVRTLVGVHAHG